MMLIRIQKDENRKQLHQLLKRIGQTFYQGEFDTTDDYAMEVFKTFPFSPCTPNRPSAWTAVLEQQSRNLPTYQPAKRCCFLNVYWFNRLSSC